MRGSFLNVVTPQRKMISISNKFQNPGIKSQQGTTRTLYDTLPLDGRLSFNFFEEVSTRSFPDTNMTSDGNKLGVGGAMIVERGYFSVITTVAGVITNIEDIEASGFFGIAVGDFSFSTANNQVIKDVSTLSWDSRFNKSAQFDGASVFEFDTQVALQPLLEFNAILRAATYTPDATKSLRLTIEGSGAIISPRGTF